MRESAYSIMYRKVSSFLVPRERAWNKMDRHVKWGERPILILGPRFKTVEEFDTTKGMWEKKKKMAGFLALPVYDVSQDDALKITEKLKQMMLAVK